MADVQSINDLIWANARGVNGMGQTITGSSGGGYTADVNAQGELRVTTDTPLMRAALLGNAFSWTNVPADIATGETMLIVRNDSSSQDLVIDHVKIHNGNAAVCNYDIHVVTAAYTNAGTDVVGVNLNTAFGSSPSKYTATADETGNTQGAMLTEFWAVLADASYHVDVRVILSQGAALGIDQVTESTRGTAQIVGYFIDK
jgi:hypothetical protein